MRKVKYEVTRTSTKGREKTTRHRTKEAAVDAAFRGVRGKGSALISVAKEDKKKTVRRRKRSKK